VFALNVFVDKFMTNIQSSLIKESSPKVAARKFITGVAVAKNHFESAFLHRFNFRTLFSG